MKEKEIVTSKKNGELRYPHGMTLLDAFRLWTNAADETKHRDATASMPCPDEEE